ncbi:MAG: mechanosensitive ion channel family protein [Anaerolineae bacterium]|nr:mechanosensitive ion channel family protein [Anaerolineae bacterium]
MDFGFITDTIGEDAAETLGKLLLIALILAITWLVRKTLDSMLPKLLDKLVARTRNRLDDRLFRILLPPLRFAAGVIGIWLAILVLDLPSGVRDIIGRLMSSLLAIALFWALHRAVELAVDIGLRVGHRTWSRPSDPGRRTVKLENAAEQVLKALIIVLAVMVILEEWDYNVGGLVAGLGIGGLAVALAAQDALANLFGYLVILADEPFVVGEYVVIGDVSGTVESVGFRSTRVRVLDQSLVAIPNKTVMNANISNWSRLGKRRLNMTLGIAYKNAPEKVLSVVQGVREMLIDHELVEADSVVVQFVEFGTAALNIMIICFMKTPNWNDFQAARQDINLRIMEILQDRGVELAVPTQTLMLERPGARQAAPGEEPIFAPLKPEPAHAPANSPVPDDAAN